MLWIVDRGGPRGQFQNGCTRLLGSTATRSTVLACNFAYQPQISNFERQIKLSLKALDLGVGAIASFLRASSRETNIHMIKRRSMQKLAEHIEIHLHSTSGRT
jgi:hypothetical protein